jgi:hypothetical protein
MPRSKEGSNLPPFFGVFRRPRFSLHRGWQRPPRAAPRPPRPPPPAPRPPGPARAPAGGPGPGPAAGRPRRDRRDEARRHPRAAAEPASGRDPGNRPAGPAPALVPKESGSLRPTPTRDPQAEVSVRPRPGRGLLPTAETRLTWRAGRGGRQPRRWASRGARTCLSLGTAVSGLGTCRGFVRIK